jgi:hypothetical protein
MDMYDEAMQRAVGDGAKFNGNSGMGRSYTLDGHVWDVFRYREHALNYATEIAIKEMQSEDQDKGFYRKYFVINDSTVSKEAHNVAENYGLNMPGLNLKEMSLTIK